MYFVINLLITAAGIGRVSRGLRHAQIATTS